MSLHHMKVYCYILTYNCSLIGIIDCKLYQGEVDLRLSFMSTSRS